MRGSLVYSGLKHEVSTFLAPKSNIDLPNIFITRVEDILVHESRPRRHLPEEGDLDRFANFHSLPLLHKYLPGILAPVLTIKTWYTVLLWMMAFFERLQRSHEVMSSCDSAGDDSFRNARCDGAFH